ncbi:MAG: hypothetical protein AB7G44_03565 [Bacteroidia bacterium]
MADDSKSIYRQIADALGCSYTHVKQVCSRQPEVNPNTALNKRIIRMYAEKTQEELNILLESIKDRATNDYIIH